MTRKFAPPDIQVLLSFVPFFVQDYENFPHNSSLCGLVFHYCARNKVITKVVTSQSISDLNSVSDEV